ncbi:MAG: hypothetical protein GKS03_05825 [Alphaproteobacteria bacterium]|nr:hypothetical protein [Alphaproteobacteria bacterium]
MSEIITGIETADGTTDLANALPGHLNVELASDFNGYLQHTIRNTRSEVLTDMSAKCALGNNS